MEELFGLSMNILMMALLAIFLAAMAVVAVLAFRNRIMVKLGLRNIPRRPAQTVLIIIGVMLSTVIVSAAFGTGDTLSYSIRSEAIKGLKSIDEVIVSARAGADDSFGADPYIPYQRFEEIQRELAGDEDIDGLTPQIGETAPALNVRTSLNEGQMRVVGLAPTLLQGFDAFRLTSGGEARLEDLAEGEAYINDRAADELEAVAGDELHLFIEGEAISLRVKGVVERGGLAGFASTTILPLESAQAIFGRAGQLNSIVVSNRGDETSGVKLSKDVTKRLRVLFSDREVASRLKELLNREAVLKALNAKDKSLSDHDREDRSQLRKELQRPEVSDELISLLSDEFLNDLVLTILSKRGSKEAEREAVTLYEELAEFRVFEFKRLFLEVADDAGSIVTKFFLVFSLFSIMVGVLLIFLIFVMLAAARRSEMGMARAVGAKRRHLVQMFTFEGTSYALVSAAVGVALGLAVSAGMVTVINRLLASFEEDFQLSIHFEARTIVVAYCLGMIVTFATVAVSAYRVSRLNIVAAVRGLPEAIVIKSESPFSQRLLLVGKALVRPLLFLGWAFNSLLRLKFGNTLRNTSLAILWGLPPFWIAGIAVAMFRFIWPYLLRGWLIFLLGLLLAGTTGRVSLFGGGVSLMILGLGLMIRTGLKRAPMRAEVRDRIALTFVGVTILVFWALPMDFFEGITGELEGDFDVMFISGVAMVAAAVWTVMYNADVLLTALTFVTGRIGKLRPVLVTAVAYPLNAKFRTGLTLAMFSLVIFTLVVMSVLSEMFGNQFAEAETITGGWEIEGSVNPNTPVKDIRQAIAEEPDLRIEDFAAIGGFTWLEIQARQVNGENQQWEESTVRAANEDFLGSTNYEFKLIAEGYGTTDEEAWQALRSDPSLAVAGGNVVATREGSSTEEYEPWIEDVYYEDDGMSAPIDIEVREPRSGTIVPLKVIGVLDRVHEYSGSIIVSKAILDDVIPFPVPITNYRFRVTEGVDTAQVSRSLEISFVEHGMNTVVMEEELEKEAAAGKTFSRLFIGFMALGLVVGIAGLGVVSTRAVVERRQQIGVLRAIGYRRGMVQLSFLLESSFVSLLGIFIGVVLGIVLSYNAYLDIKEDEGIGTIRYSIPWLQITVIIALTYLFSLVATFLPARQASRIYPAEALRYE